MMKYTDLLFLGAPLPEDVEKLKWHGDLAHAARRIDKYLEGDLPQAQCSRHKKRTASLKFFYLHTHHPPMSTC